MSEEKTEELEESTAEPEETVVKETTPKESTAESEEAVIEGVTPKEPTVESEETVVKRSNPKESTAESEETVVEEATPSNPDFKWYILQAYAQYENRVEKTIREKLRIEKLEHLVEEIFIPSEDVTKTKGGKKRTVNQKYFPGYILIKVNLKPELWHLLMNTPRVSGFVGGTQKNPLPLDEKELKEITSQIDSGAQQAVSEEEFVIGQKVLITEGPFSNFNGLVDEINREKRKLKVLVSIFGRATPVEVEFDKVKSA